MKSACEICFPIHSIIDCFCSEYGTLESFGLKISLDSHFCGLPGIFICKCCLKIDTYNDIMKSGWFSGVQIGSKIQQIYAYVDSVVALAYKLGAVFQTCACIFLLVIFDSVSVKPDLSSKRAIYGFGHDLC